MAYSLSYSAALLYDTLSDLLWSIVDQQHSSDPLLQGILLEGGLSYATEWPKCLQLLQDQAGLGRNTSDIGVLWETLGVWYERMFLSIQVSVYKVCFLHQ